jgi:thioredoxin 1
MVRRRGSRERKGTLDLPPRFACDRIQFEVMTRRLRALWLPAVLACTLAAGAQWKKTPLRAPTQINPQLYRADANATEEINRALVAAGKQHKRILLDFGGNWCIDCHVLENAFHQPRIAPLLNDNFIVVHVDVGRYDKNLDLAKKYHVDLRKGVPSLAVLDARGKVLYATGDFERASVMSEDDVIAFLEQWKPPVAPKK